MSDFLAWLVSLPQNPMFAGLTGATVIGGVMVMARQLPLRLWNLSLLAVSAQVTVKSEDPVFWWIVNWLSTSEYGRTARRMRLESKSAHASDAPSSGPQQEAVYVLSPSDGMHWFFHRSALLVVNRGKENGGATGANLRLREEITLRAFTWNARSVIARLIQDARESTASGDAVTRVYTHSGWNWCTPFDVPQRPMASVILRCGVAETLLADAAEFFDRREWYRERAIPWRRGYLLYGPPGCGKSSIAHALASELDLSVAALSLASVQGDGALRDLMVNLPRKCLLLIEDIDAAFVQREAKEIESVSFSGLLNVIDGIAAAEGRILVMTTNHIERIDAALRRPGRADFEILIDVADEGQAARMYRRFVPNGSGCDEFARENAGRSPAEIQGHLMAIGRNESQD
jgi:chaperone BCS1